MASTENFTVKHEELYAGHTRLPYDMKNSQIKLLKKSSDEEFRIIEEALRQKKTSPSVNSFKMAKGKEIDKANETKTIGQRNEDVSTNKLCFTEQLVSSSKSKGISLCESKAFRHNRTPEKEESLHPLDSVNRSQCDPLSNNDKGCHEKTPSCPTSESTKSRDASPNLNKTKTLFSSTSGLKILSFLSTKSRSTTQKLITPSQCAEISKLLEKKGCTKSVKKPIGKNVSVSTMPRESTSVCEDNALTSQSTSKATLSTCDHSSTSPAKEKFCAKDLVPSNSICTVSFSSPSQRRLPPDQCSLKITPPPPQACMVSSKIPTCRLPHTPPLKENESPQSPQSEPIMRTWIPPMDDPMSQTFLRMPFTYQSLQFQRNHDNQRHVKRPMNAFMVWAKKNRANIAKRFPNASNAEISVRLGHIWNQLPSSDQKPYFDEANQLKEKHRHENPNWVYQPRQGRKCRKALFTSASTSSTHQPMTLKRGERPIYSRSTPNSPTVKRPLWTVNDAELSEEELQTRIVEDLLEEEKEENTGNPTMDKYIDEWLSPKKTKRDHRICLMNDAMLPSAIQDDDEQNILEEEMHYDGKDFENYIKELKHGQNDFTRFDQNMGSLFEEDDDL